MLGTLVNAGAIIVCSLIGKLFVKNVPERVSEAIIKAIAITLIFIGISGAMKNESILLLIISMIAGAVLGELIDIDKGMNKLGKWAESKLGQGDSNFSKGFVSATILFCTGSMAIVGSLESGLAGNHEILFAKSILDGIISVVFASRFGIGVLFSFVPVLMYQGLIVIGATYVRDWLTAAIITEMSAVGSLLIAVIGFNFLGVKEIKVANMIPAIFLPWLFIAMGNFIQTFM